MGGAEELQEHGDVAASDQVQPPGRRPRRTDHGALTADAVAVAALTIGVLACSFSWMFFIRSYIVLAGVVAALLGVFGIVAARRNDRSPALPAAGAVLGALAIIAVFT